MEPDRLLLHPVRLRIVQQFLGRGELTTGRLRELMPDVPAATLYRHVNALAAGHVLQVVGEAKVRGASERTYAIDLAEADLDGMQAARMDADAHQRAFTTFVAGLLGDFDRYLASGSPDLARDLVGYRQVALHLSDEEMGDLLADLRDVLEAYASLPSAPGRTRRILTTVVMPSPEPAG